jgi:hypothetical protein
MVVCGREFRGVERVRPLSEYLIGVPRWQMPDAILRPMRCLLALLRGPREIASRWLHTTTLPRAHDTRYVYQMAPSPDQAAA